MTTTLEGTRRAFEAKIPAAEAVLSVMDRVVVSGVIQPLRDLIDFYQDFLRDEILKAEKKEKEE